MALKIPRRLLAEMIAHALEEDPEECCGLLLGNGDVAEASRRMTNAHKNKVSRYTMDPRELMAAEQDADAAHQKFVAIYHSHTYTQAHPSETDIDNAVESGWTDPYYVLVSLVEKTRPVVRAFKIGEDRRLNEVIITTDGQAYRGSSK